jgi:hypothetical protein
VGRVGLASESVSLLQKRMPEIGNGFRKHVSLLLLVAYCNCVTQHTMDAITLDDIKADRQEGEH